MGRTVQLHTKYADVNQRGGGKCSAVKGVATKAALQSVKTNFSDYRTSTQLISLFLDSNISRLRNSENLSNLLLAKRKMFGFCRRQG